MNEIAGGVGARMPRLEAREKITGQARYCDDLFPQDVLHGALLTSPYPHARILACDTAAAAALPGVRAVVTGADVAEDRRGGPFIKDEHAITRDKVRYVGEPVAAVAADDIETARCAALLIEVAYEELPAVLSPEQGLEADAPLVHENLADYAATIELPVRGNLLQECEISTGDVDSAWAECDVVVEGEFETQGQYHAYLEPCSAIAEVDANGKVTVWSSNQSVFRDQANLADRLGIPMSRIRAVSPRVGGAFGGKIEMTNQALAVLLAMKARKPVKLTLTREQDMEMIRARHPAKVRMKTGATSDGRLVARETEILMDCGAYACDSPGVVGVAAWFARGPYHIDHVRSIGRGVYTNKLRFGAFRGFGGPQVAWAGEQQLDEIAERIGMDPIDLRIANAVQAEREWVAGIELAKSDLATCLTAVREASGWAAKRAAKADGGSRRRGIGIACVPHISGVLSSSAIVRLLEDGTVVLSTGAVDNGQGSDTVLVQICAEALGVPTGRISFTQPDTDASPYNWGTSASRVTYTTGRAVVGAAEEAVAKLKQHAGEMMECAAEDLELRPGGRIGLKGVPDAVLTFADISGYCHWVSGGPIIGAHSVQYEGADIADPTKAVIKHFPFRFGVYTFAAQAVEIEVDEETGRIEPLEVWSAHDIGKAINPMAVEGQVEGGVVQGLGYALYEELAWDSGRLANPSLMDYKIPGIMDSPPAIHTHMIENPHEDGPFGAKGIGEPPIVGIAPAIGNALHQASGVRLTRLPMTPERVLDAVATREVG